MSGSTFLAIANKDTKDTELKPLIDAIRKSDGHLAILVIGTVPPVPLYAYSSTPYGPAFVPDEWQIDLSVEQTKVDTKAEQLEALLQSEGVSGDVTSFVCEQGRVADAVARRAMLCDHVYVAPDLRRDEVLFKNVTYGVLFRSPIGMILNDADAISTNRGTVFVAWNTSLQSARAVHRALPMLKAADQVVIATFDPLMTQEKDGENPGSDVAKWLTHHGCKVDVKQFPSGGKEIGDCILERAKEVGAGMIVAGAYGHSRLREATFGGTTQTLIKQDKFPVFLAH